jgi:hypothetical protein
MHGFEQSNKTNTSISQSLWFILTIGCCCVNNWERKIILGIVGGWYVWVGKIGLLVIPGMSCALLKWGCDFLSHVHWLCMHRSKWCWSQWVLHCTVSQIQVCLDDRICWCAMESQVKLCVVHHSYVLNMWVVLMCALPVCESEIGATLAE